MFPAWDPSAESGHVLSVKVIDNVRIPSFSELEILAQVRGDGDNNCYMLESNLQNSDLLVARAVVTPGDVVPVRLLNPTGKSITLYSGASMAVLSEVVDIGDNPSEEHNMMENTVKVSAVGGDKERPLIEEMLMELVKETSLSGQHQDLLLTLLLDNIQIFLLDLKMNWVVQICCSTRSLPMVQLLFVNGLEDYPQRSGQKCVQC